MLDALAWAEGTADDPNNGYGTVAYGKVLRAPDTPSLSVNVTSPSLIAKDPYLLIHELFHGARGSGEVYTQL
jgi:hypothetical protein